MMDDLRALSNATVTLVMGSPCAGKTTYVREHKTNRDVVIDYDTIAQALGSPVTHGHPKALVPYIIHIRDALLDRIETKRPTTNVWIVACNPSSREYALADNVVTLDTDATECKARAIQAGRPSTWPRLIDEWHTAHR